LPQDDSEAPVRFHHISPYFIVDDVAITAEYYRDILGFDPGEYWGEPPRFAMVRRDDIQIILALRGEAGTMNPNRKVQAKGTWDAYIDVTGLDVLHEALRAKGARILRGPGKTSYGTREFEVEDCNGYVLCFGEEGAG